MGSRVIISGGGTGGHIFPAVSIANALKKLDSTIEILFVGAKGRMEMEKVPAAGYTIVGLPVAGFQRRITFENVTFFFKLASSLWKARKIVRQFKPDAVVGVGGYASGPMLRTAAGKGIPTLIQEQNSYAGVTNKLLAKKASKICVAYDGMEKYFPAGKIIFTGNPIRQDLENIQSKREEAIRFFNLDPKKKTILSLGGSLGARTINNCIAGQLGTIASSDVQLIWQCGKIYHAEASGQLKNVTTDNIRLYDFISRMDLAYAAADVIISRAGAGSISELCMVGKPVILVPSPNVAEDHQTKNALALVNKGAALLVRDNEASQKLIGEAMRLIGNDAESRNLAAGIVKLATRDSAKTIAEEILKLMK